MSLSPSPVVNGSIAPARDRAEALERLLEGIRELTSSQRWAEWLRFCSRFHRYSFHNQVLILAQRPEATWVAGYRGWQRLGRQVRRGERGIAIFAPCALAGPGPAEQDDLPVPTGFRVVRVFDLAQTDGRELPSPLQDLQDDAVQVQLDPLLALGGRLGFAIEFVELRGDRHGDCSHALRRIRLDSRLGRAQMTKTLCHELAHALLHGADFDGDRSLAELEAESVAYVVCHHLGIDSSGYSFGYVASWAGGAEEAVARISAAGARIVGTAARIVEATGRASPCIPG
ncbi:MAG: ArdC-like ssDNA-binding domain-containing protein [Candidatus Dormibacteria bacterium]